MESGTTGYPEDQPREVHDSQTAPEGGEGPREAADIPDADDAPDNEEGTATGTRQAAGADE